MGTKVLRPNNSRRRRQAPPPAPTNNQLVMGQVRILKRGEVLKDLNNNFSKSSGNTATSTTVVKKMSVSFSKENMLELCSTGRLGPNPEDIAVYAGSGFFTSPPPCKLPLPGFLEKIGDVACSGLRRTICLDDDMI